MKMPATLGAYAVLSVSLAAAAPAPVPTVRPAPSPPPPCGIVEFIPTRPTTYSQGTASEHITAMVTFADGHRETAAFPYPWVYPDAERTDPWSDTNIRKDASSPVTLQLPPPGTDTSGYPALIRYVLSHTDAQGYTDLSACSPTRERPLAPQPRPSTSAPQPRPSTNAPQR